MTGEIADQNSIEVLRHSLGLSSNGHSRNYFVTGPGSPDYDTCLCLENKGLMVSRPAPGWMGKGDVMFFATQKGIEIAHGRALAGVEGDRRG